MFALGRYGVRGGTGNIRSIFSGAAPVDEARIDLRTQIKVCCTWTVIELAKD
jgi:hypothetical protein